MPTQMHIKPAAWPPNLQAMAKTGACKLISAFTANQWIRVYITEDAGLLHISVSHPRRFPTWDEIKAIRYNFAPKDKTLAVLLPPLEEYVNLHDNCFHLWEVPELTEAIPRPTPAACPVPD